MISKHTQGLDVEKLVANADKSFKYFENDVIPMWRRMDSDKINVAKENELLEKKANLPKRIIERVFPEEQEHPDRSAWTYFNDFTRYLTHDYDKSYDRNLDLNKRISTYFEKKYELAKVA